MLRADRNFNNGWDIPILGIADDIAWRYFEIVSKVKQSPPGRPALWQEKELTASKTG